MSSPARRGAPEFWIVGAPKSGTTALYAYLRQHPSIYLPERKEIRYFGSDLVPRRWRHLSLDDYLAFFDGATNGQVVGTAYVWNLMSTNAANEIREFQPRARIIAMLRNPPDMLYSLHSENLYNGNEDIQSFEAALSAEEDRRKGVRIPETADLPQALFYSTIPRYARQLERYVTAFGEDRVLPILFDDFVQDTPGTYRRVLEFLDVEAAFRPAEFHAVNPNKRARNAVIRRFLAHPPEIIRSAIRKSVPTGIRRSMYRLAVEANARKSTREPLARETRARLQQEFEPEIRQLEAMLGRRLDAWRGTRDD